MEDEEAVLHPEQGLRGKLSDLVAHGRSRLYVRSRSGMESHRERGRADMPRPSQGRRSVAGRARGRVRPEARGFGSGERRPAACGLTRQLRRPLEDLVASLEKSAESNIRISKTGSPVTSMAEDHTIGEVGAEQRLIANKLRDILKMPAKKLKVPSKPVEKCTCQGFKLNHYCPIHGRKGERYVGD